MKYSRFEDLPVWRHAIDFAVCIFAVVEDGAFNRRGDLRNQLERAATSVSNNIAEGFERGTTQELITFLYYARGSAGEVRSMLHLCDRLPFLADPNLKSQISNLKSQAEGISRQLCAWADSLQNTEIKGQRYLTDAAREEQDRRVRVAAFLDKLEAVKQSGRQAKPADS